MADPIAALIAAGKAAKEDLALAQRVDSDYNLGYCNGQVAAYDPALLPALAALQAERDALRAALAPLAAQEVPDGMAANKKLWSAGQDRIVITAGDVRRARALLGKG